MGITIHAKYEVQNSEGEWVDRGYCGWCDSVPLRQTFWDVTSFPPSAKHPHFVRLGPSKGPPHDSDTFIPGWDMTLRDLEEMWGGCTDDLNDLGWWRDIGFAHGYFTHFVLDELRAVDLSADVWNAHNDYARSWGTLGDLWRRIICEMEQFESGGGKARLILWFGR